MRAAPRDAEELLLQMRAQVEERSSEEWCSLAASYATAGDMVGANQALERMVAEIPAAADIMPLMRSTLNLLPEPGSATDAEIWALVPDRVAVPQEARIRFAVYQATTDETPEMLEALLAAESESLPAALAAEVFNGLLFLYALARDLGKVELTLDRMAAASMPVDATCWPSVIDTAGSRGGFEAAQAMFDRAVRAGTEPTPGMWAELAAGARTEADGVDAVMRVVQSAERADELATEVLNELIHACAVADPAGASAAFALLEAHGLDPDARSWRYLALALQASERHEEADDILVSACERFPDEPALLFMRLSLADILDRSQDAGRVTRRLIELGTPDRLADFRAPLARLAAALGEDRAATVIALLDRWPDNPEWPFRVFRDALVILAPQYGRVAPLLLAFPELFDEDDARLLIERTSSDELLARIRALLPELFPDEDPDPNRARVIAAEITGHDLLEERSVGELEAAAEAGDLDAAEFLEYVAKADGDLERSTYWNERTLALDGTEVTVRTAIRYFESFGGFDDLMEQLTAAAALGNSLAAFYLGRLASAAGRPATAEEFWLLAAERGSAQAPGALAAMYESQNRDEEALRWAREAAGLGDPVGYSICGFLAVVDGREDEAEELLRESLAHGGTARSVDLLATLLRNQGRVGEAAELLRTAAEDGDAEAAYHLSGLLLSHGEQAASDYCLARAAALGQARAAAMLGLKLLTDRERVAAKYWCLRSAEAGEPLAGVGLAGLYLRYGDPDKAEHWFRWTLEQGDAEALEELLWRAARIGPRSVARRWRKEAAAALS